MKKLIAVSVVLALVVGSAFAEWTWNARVDIGAVLAQGDDDDDSEITGQLRSPLVRFWTTGSRETNVGTFGGMVLLDRNALNAGEVRAFGEAWWRPIDMLWLGLGNDLGRLDNIARGGDGFHRDLAGVGGGWIPNFAPSLGGDEGFIGVDRAFYRGMSTGFIADVNVMDMVDFGIGLPYGTTANEVADIMQGINARVRVNLDGIGRIGFAYAGSAADDNNGTIFASFHSGDLVPGLALNFGVGFYLLEDAEELAIGFGVGWGAAEQFGVGFRGSVGIGIGDYAAWDLRMAFQAVPRFNVTPDVSVLLPVGFALNMHDDADDPLIGWRVNPYIRVNLGWPAFAFGFDIWGSSWGSDNSALNWAVPIGMRVQF